MADPFAKVQPGEPLKIHAAAWNRMLDTVRQPHAVAAEPGEIEQASNIVLVRNQTGQPVPAMGVMQVSGVAITPVGGSLTGTDAASSRSRSFVQRPILSGGMPSAASNSIAVALEPIAENAIGRCAIGGVFAVKVHITQSSHEYAGGRPNDVTQLASAACGPVRLLWKEPFVSGANRWAVGKM